VSSIGKKNIKKSLTTPPSGRSGQLENYFSWEFRNWLCSSPAYQSLSILNLISYCWEVTPINTPSPLVFKSMDTPVVKLFNFWDIDRIRTYILPALRRSHVQLCFEIHIKKTDNEDFPILSSWGIMDIISLSTLGGFLV
jgi:hypothetical protein